MSMPAPRPPAPRPPALRPLALRPKVAIACQGGGSHAAFTAGVLAELLSPANRDRFEPLALSGTSGGAVSAALAWAGLLGGGPDDAIERLEGFWRDLAPSDPWEALVNAWTQAALALPFAFRSSPYAYVPAAEPELRRLLEVHLRPQSLPARRAPPFLRIGAANVLRGGGEVFRGEDRFRLDDVIASAAVPPLFRAVPNRGALWWDGLYAHNPPVRALLDLPEKPEEIWIIRLNPVGRATHPRMPDEIEDRRNELAGNLPLDHEVHKIRIVNRVLGKLGQPATDAFGWRPVRLRQVVLGRVERSYRSKFDRSAANIRDLMEEGRAAAEGFFGQDSVLDPLRD